MTTVSLRVTSVTIAAPDPRQLAHFYADLLGRPVTTEEPPLPGQPSNAGWAQIGPGTTVEPTLNFEYEEQWSAPVWPSEAGHQCASQHLDILVEDLGPAVEHALAVGASLAQFQPQPDVRVLYDPAGHPFCLFT